MKKLLNALGTVLLAATVLISAVSCTPATSEPIHVTAINMKTEESIFIGASVTLSTTFEPTNANQIQLTWESDKPDIAAVDQKGKVTAISLGTATITATAPSGVTASCTVTVNSIKVTNLTINYTGEQSIFIGETLQIIPEITPANATDKSVTYKSSDETVASISETGLVTGLKAGTTTITVTANSFESSGSGSRTRTFTLNVRSKPYPVISYPAGSNYDSINNRLASYAGSTIQLTATMSDSSESSYTWTSSNEDVVKVDSTGKVTFIGVSGNDYSNSASAEITCTSANGEKTSMKVRSSINTSFTLSGGSLDSSWKTFDKTYIATVNSKLEFTIFFASSSTGSMRITDGAVTGITISSSNTEVAEIVTPYPKNKNYTLEISTKSAGETVISVVAPGYEHSFTLRVSDINSVSLNKKELCLIKDSTEQLIATVSPDSAANKTVIWSSSNSSVATVDSTGTVTAVSAGSAIITATSEADDSRKATCTVNVRNSAYPILDYSKWGYECDASYKEVTAYPGATAHIVVSMNDGSASTYKYSTNIPDYVHIASDGTVTFTGENVANDSSFVKVGTLTITSDATGESETINIKVSVHGDLSLSSGWGKYGATYNVKVGEKFECKVMYQSGVKYGGCNPIACSDYTFTSSDTSIATVAINPSKSKELLITGVSTGQVTININVNGIEKSFCINVTE